MVLGFNDETAVAGGEQQRWMSNTRPKNDTLHGQLQTVNTQG